MPGFATFFTQKQGLRIFIALLCLAAVVLAGERLMLSRLESGWEEASRAEADRSRHDMQDCFASFQAETRAVVDGALRDLEREQPGDRASQFETLAASTRDGVTLELCDSLHEVLAWSGNRGPLIDADRLTPEPSSFVLQGPIYTYLIVALPVQLQGNGRGTILGKRLFDVNFPINNRFISSRVFTSTFTSRLDAPVEFRFPAAQSTRGDSLSVYVDLHGVDGSPIGTALVPRPLSPVMADGIHHTAMTILGIIAFVALAVLAVGIIPHLARRRSPAGRGLLWTFFIWTARYLFVWLEFPKSLFPGALFDPGHFASPFGAGLAQSLADVLLTSAALLVNVLLIVVPGLERLRRSTPPGPASSSPRRLVLAVFLPLSAILLFLFLRGYYATIHSAVFDSSLAYNDPATLLPTSEVAVMLLCLFLLALALVAAGIGILMSAHALLRRTYCGLSPIAAWGILAALYLVLSFIFGSLYHHSLMSQGARALVLAGGVLLAAWTSYRLGRGGSAAGIALILALAAIIIVVPPLDAKVHELDRDHVGLMAHEILRPADGWLNVVVNRALDEVTQGRAAEVLQSGDPGDIDKLAFTQWAGSILSKEGNNCSVTFVNAEGSVVSDFHIGIAPQWFRRHHMDEMPRSTKLVEVEDRSDAGGIVKWYRGYAPVFAGDTLFLGGVWIDLSGVNQRMLRGESEEILRNSSREDFAAHHRRLYFFEYFEGQLVASTAEDAALRSALPAEVGNHADSSDGLWVEPQIGGKSYEMYFLPDGSRGKAGSWIALGMESLDARWHVYTFLRYVGFFLLVALAGLACFLITHAFRGSRPAADFRTKLLVAFTVVSLIPVVILGSYNRISATERAAEVTQRELGRQTSVVAAELERTLGANTPALLARVSDEQCSELAAAMDIDFNVYDGGGLQASSKPEMFTAELLDRSLGAEAFLNVVLGRKSFFAENQTIGSLPYIVGYRPLLADNGNVIGVVSVPTLYSRNEIETELTERNAFLYGSYAFALVLSLVAGSLFANQIASPVRRLKRATAELARGNMNVELQRSGTDELGDLEEAFARMTTDLRRTQAEMLKAQKELAWREMAQQVAHEIKNPLTPMKLSVQHLRQAYRDKAGDFGEVLQRVSTTVLEQIDALSRIASEFSSFARMPERKVEPVDLHAILEEAKNLFHLESIAVVMELQADRSVVLADREELRRVFINILRNSVQAMDEHGEIVVATFSSEGRITATLRDNGPGIPEEIRKRLFEPNFSTKTDGMGLGLTIVRATIESLGGTILVESGEGTTVSITLPLEGA